MNEPDDSAHMAVFERSSCQYLGIFSICRNTACRRARDCRGNAHFCLKTNFPRLPDGVRDWFIGLLGGGEESFDEACERMAKTPSAQAFAAWRASLPG
jgi:hypothetical protein